MFFSLSRAWSIFFWKMCICICPCSCEEILVKRPCRLVHNHALWPFRLVVLRDCDTIWVGEHTQGPFRFVKISRIVFWRRGSGEEITEREEIKAGKSNEKFLQRGSGKETKDYEVVKNFCSSVEIKDWKRDQGVRRRKKLPRVFAKRSRPAKTMKNSR